MDSAPLISSSEDDEESPEPKCCATGGSGQRFLALVLMCLLGFGSYFCYDNPGALQDIILKEMSLSATEYSYLYTFYSWPNVILCFIGGFLIDKVLGIKVGTVVYAFITVLGQLITALGAYCNSLWVMCLGRAVFGMGGESLAVAQNYYAVVWFKGRELNMVFGLQLSIARVGSGVNFLVVGHIYHWLQKWFTGYSTLGVTLFITSATCVMSLLCSCLLGCMNHKPVNLCEPQAAPKQEEEVRITDVKYFKLGFWIVCFICIVYYVAIFPYISLSKVFFMNKYGMTSAEANALSSLLYLLSAVASPIMGLLVDKTGRNVMWVTSSIIVTLGAHALLAFTFVHPVICQVILGLGYSLLASALWPLISLIIPERQLGTAYGMAQALQNGGMGCATMAAGYVVDNGGYFLLEIFFLGNLLAALVAALLMWAYDASTSGVLNMTVSQRASLECQQEGEERMQREALLRSGSIQEVSPYSVTQPQSHHNIRNRYLSRVGGSHTVLKAPPEVFAYRRFR